MLLTFCLRAIRVEKYSKLLNHLKNKERNVSISVDERKIIVDVIAKRQSNRVIVCKPSDVSHVMQSQNPATVMFFAAVTSLGMVMPTYFIEAVLKNKHRRLFEDPENVLLPCIRENYDPSKVMLV